jgi:O-antigen ligase
VSDVLATGTTRSGGNIANPIHFADVALLAGFVGLLGVFFAEERFRMVFFAGPAMSIIAVVLSGTRGAVVAASVMIAWVAIMAALTKVIAIRPLILAALATLIAGAVAVALGAASLSGVQRVLVDIVDVVQHGVPTDTSTDQRLQMYLGGLRAFLASPVFGHGPANFTAVANNLADLPFGGAPHLHNDLINMAASAGSLGIAAYLIIILAPLVEILTLPNTIAKSRLLVGVTGLLAGYVVMGLTNAMFGILTITIMFTAICVLSGLMARGIRGAEVGESNLERQPVTSPAPRLTSG